MITWLEPVVSKRNSLYQVFNSTKIGKNWHSYKVRVEKKSYIPSEIFVTVRKVGEKIPTFYKKW